MKDMEKGTTPKSKWRKFAKKRWVYPAVYLVAAALIMSGVLWMQNDSSDLAGKEDGNGSIAYHKGKDNDAVPVNGAKEVFAWPTANEDAVEVKKQFYDVNGTPEEQQAALVTYNKTYTQNTGINIVAKDGETFAVNASMSGTVVKAEKDELLGYVVQLDHGDDVTTLYQSLESVAVEPGQVVEQGDLLGQAGRSVYNKDAGIHLHFEIRKGDMPVNPIAYFKKGVASLDDAMKTTGDTESGSEAVNEDSNNKAPDENNRMAPKENDENTTPNESEQQGAQQDSDVDSNDYPVPDDQGVDDSGANS